MEPGDLPKTFESFNAEPLIIVREALFNVLSQHPLMGIETIEGWVRANVLDPGFDVRTLRGKARVIDVLKEHLHLTHLQDFAQDDYKSYLGMVLLWYDYTLVRFQEVASSPIDYNINLATFVIMEKILISASMEHAPGILEFMGSQSVTERLSALQGILEGLDLPQYYKDLVDPIVVY